MKKYLEDFYKEEPDYEEKLEEQIENEVNNIIYTSKA